MALCHFGAVHDGRTDTTVDADVVEGDCELPCGNLVCSSIWYSIPKASSTLAMCWATVTK